MIKKNRVIALIPARGGSKSIPEKNLSLLGDKPLIELAIGIAKKCGLIDRVIVSTDNIKIKKFAINCGAEVYKRPKKLSGDKSLIIDTVRYLFKVLQSEGENADIIILLEPTSPFRDIKLIEKCLKRLVYENLDSLATFHEAEIHPEKTWHIKDNKPSTYIKKVDPWTPRQSLVKAYQLNGLVYTFYPAKIPMNINGLLFGSFGGEVISSNKIIDIDDEKDLIMANMMLEKFK